MSKIAQIDIDKLIDLIGDGKTYREMATEFGVKLSTLSDFIAKPEHSARVKEALRLSADTYADKAEQVLIDAKGTKEEIMRARELSQYYKWKASKRSPKDYGDKIQSEVVNRSTENPFKWEEIEGNKEDNAAL